MDLTGRFTGKLGGETDFNSVRNAIESVDAFFSSALRKEAEEEECLQFFFKDEKAAQPNEHYFDIMDFWKTIEPYVWNWAGEDLKDFWIIRVMKEVETVREVANYNKILDQETKEHLYILRRMSESIEDLPKKGTALKLCRDENADKIEVVYSLRYFDEQCYHPYREFIMQNLYMLLKNGGRLLVTTSQDEYFVYEMGHFEWKRDRMDNQEAYKICMSREDSAIRKGLIAGFVYDELK